MKNVKYLIPLLTLLLFFFLLLIPSANATAQESTPSTASALSPPTFTLSPLSFTYDGFVHLLKVQNLTHEREDEGFYTFSWYKDGRLLESSAASLPIRTVSDSGSYTVSVTFTLGGESVFAYSSSVTVSVLPLEISRPALLPLIYNGKHQYAHLEESPYYRVVENEGGTDVGEYPLTLELCDPENTVWQDGDASPYRTTLQILQAKNEWLDTPYVLDTYLGTTPSFVAYPRFGTAHLTYGKEKDGPYSLVLPGSTGTLYVRVLVEGTSNYTALYSEVFEIEIRENLPVSIRLEAPPDKTVYTAFDSVDLTGIRISVTHMDGSVTLADVRALRVLYDTYPSALSASDSGVTVALGDLKARLPLTVKKATYDIQGITFEGASLVYSGEYLTLTPCAETIVGKDGIPLRWTVSGGGTDAGDYAVTLAFLTESPNYECPASRVVTLTILPKTVSLNWELLTFVYDGEIKTPVASFVNAFGSLSYAQVDGGKVNAGRDYIARARGVQNYTFENDTVRFTVLKGEYDFSTVMWSALSFVYDGTQKEVRLSGLPMGVTVLSYSQNRASQAGEYTASATFSYDSENYNAPSCPPHSWRIEKARYDLTSFEILGGLVTYDGKPHIPTVVGALPTGLDGIRLTLSFSGYVTDVSEGGREIVATFSTVSKNYELPSPITVTMAVVPAPITVRWESLSFVYDGASHLPVATHPDLPVTVLGEQAAAGEYVATAHTPNENYYITNPKCAYVIQKAKNEWLIPLTLSDIYTSETPSPEAGARYGEVEFIFFDTEGREVAPQALREGRYTCVATVSESENYTRLTSSPVPFTVYEVVPTSLLATLNRSNLVAYERLSSSDFTVRLLYNDGSTSPVSDFSIFYEGGDFLRASDTHLTLRHGAWELTLPITVKKAKLSAQAVGFSFTTVTYREEGYTLEVLSLPEGVTLLSLSQADFLTVGTYEVEALFSLDTENYEGDGRLTHTVTVERLSIPTPILSPLAYTGSLQYPDLTPCSLYTVTYLEQGKNAGDYQITIRLIDSYNTAFQESDTDTLTFIYTIKRAPLTLTLSDITVYRDGAKSDFSYYISEGRLFADDTLALTPVLGDTVSAEVSHLNYEITIIDGKMIYSSRNKPLENENAIWWLSVVVLVILLALLLLNFRPVRKGKQKSRATPPDFPTPQAAPPSPLFEEEITSSSDDDNIAIFDILPSAEYEDEEERLSPSASDEDDTPETVTQGALVRFLHGALRHRKKTPSREKTSTAQEEILYRTELPQSPDFFGISEDEADRLLSDRSAEALLEYRNAPIITYGKRRAIINIDTLSQHFTSGERIDIEILKSRSLIPYDTLHIKVLARGTINKPLYVFANDFSLCAVKMLLLSGGKAIRQKTKSVGFSFGKKPKRKS